MNVYNSVRWHNNLHNLSWMSLSWPLVIYWTWTSNFGALPLAHCEWVSFRCVCVLLLLLASNRLLAYEWAHRCTCGVTISMLQSPTGVILNRTHVPTNDNHDHNTGGVDMTAWHKHACERTPEQTKKQQQTSFVESLLDMSVLLPFPFVI